MLQHLNRKKLYLGAGALSLLLSLWSILSNWVLSNDSILYLRTAEAFHDAGFTAALELYPWPLLSILIAWMHTLTGVSFEHSAYLLSALFYLLLVWVFIKLVAELGGSERTQLIAAFMILAFPTLNDYRDYIIRDQAYWGLILLSLLQLLYLRRSGSWKHAFGWALSIAVAVGFRTEGLLLLTLAPLSLLWLRDSDWSFRVQPVARAYASAFALALVIAIPIWLAVESFSQTRIYAELAGAAEFFNNIDKGIDRSVSAIKEAVGNPYFSTDAKLVFVSGLLAALVAQGVHAFTPVFLALLLWARLRRTDAFSYRLNQACPIIFGYLLVIALYLIISVLSRQFVNDRFMVPFCLVLLLYVPFAVDRVITVLGGLRLSAGWAVLLLLLAYPMLDTLISTGPDKGYIGDAEKWLQSHGADQKSLLTNSRHIAYFNGNRFDDCSLSDSPITVIKNRSCEAPALLAFEVKRKDADLRAALEGIQETEKYSLVESFKNSKQDELMILVLSGG